MAIKGINHVALKGRDLEESRKFFELLGFEQSGHSEGMLFFAVGDHHHHIALVEGGPKSRRRARNSMGVIHYAVSVDEEADLERLCRLMSEAGYRIRRSIDHIASLSFYVEDANGITVEVTYDVPRKDWAIKDNPLGSTKPYPLRGAPDSERLLD